MKKQRFVLTDAGEEPMPPGDLVLFREKIRVLNQSRRCLLVESRPEHLRRLLKTRPRWLAGPGRVYHKTRSLPGRRPTGTNHLRLGLMLLVIGLIIFLPPSC